MSLYGRPRSGRPYLTVSCFGETPKNHSNPIEGDGGFGDGFQLALYFEGGGGLLAALAPSLESEAHKGEEGGGAENLR